MSSEVVPLASPKLRDLRSAEQATLEAYDAVKAARDAYGTLAGEFDLARQLRERGLDAPERSELEERRGLDALTCIEAAQEAFLAARQHLIDCIRDAVRNNWLHLGETILSPGRLAPLIVAVISTSPREPELSEVTLSADGGPVQRSQHSWPINSEGRPELDDAGEVAFERWWAQGLRVAGTVHPTTRQLIDTD